MSEFPYRSALIVGAGPGISASVARLLAQHGVKVALAARGIQKLDSLMRETGAQAFAADAADPQSVAKLFETWRTAWERPKSSSTTPEPASRTFGRSRSECRASCHFNHGLRRLSRHPAGGEMHAASRARRDPAHRRDRERQRLRAVRGFRHG